MDVLSIHKKKKSNYTLLKKYVYVRRKYRIRSLSGKKMPRMCSNRKIMPKRVLDIFGDLQYVLTIVFMKNTKNTLWASLIHSLFARTRCVQFITEKSPQLVLATILNTPNTHNPFYIFRVTPITQQQLTNIPTTH